MILTFSLDRPLLAILIALLLCAWALRAYARTLPPLPSGRRWLLTLLRLAASLLLALMIGGLNWTRITQQEQKPRLRVLVDASASMERPLAGSGGISRYERARDLTRQAQEHWGDRLEILTQAFALESIADSLPGLPRGGGTDIGGALAALPAPRPGESLLLLSDGRDTEGGLWAGSLAPGRVLHTVLLGDTLAPPDLRIDSVDAAPVLHKGARLPLVVEIGTQGGGPRQGRLTVREGERLLAEKEWQLPEGESRQRLELPLVFEDVGQKLLEIRLEAEGPDAAPENNRRLVTLRVVEGELRILVLAGKPDWDLTALMLSLRGEATLAPSLVSAGPEGELRLAATGEPWSADPAGYHGLVLHSLHERWPENLLEDLPLRGGVLFMGAYLQRPGRVRRPERWRLGNLPASIRGLEMPLSWGEGATRHAAMQGARATGLDPGVLTPVESVLGDVLTGGRVLLRAQGRPVLSARERGQQRLAALALRGGWRWVLPQGDGGNLLAEILSGLLRWIAREDPPDRLALNWEGEALQAGRPGSLSAEVFDEDFAPVLGARLNWSLRQGEELLGVGEFETGGEDDPYRAALPALPAGAYELRVEARTPAGEELERVLDLPVLPPDREYRQPAANAETLRWLAERTDGRFLLPADVMALDDVLDFTPRRQSLERVTRIWQHPLTFLLFLALLAAEWGLRKRFGMI